MVQETKAESSECHGTGRDGLAVKPRDQEIKSNANSKGGQKHE